MSKYKLSTQLIKNICSGPLKVFLNAIVVFFSYRYFLQVFGPNKYAIWLLLAVIVDFGRLGSLGVNDVAIKYIAEAKQQNNIPRISAYITTCLTIIVVFFTIIFIPIFLIKNAAPSFLQIDPQYTPLFFEMYDKILFLSFLTVVMDFMLGILYGLNRADFANYLQSGGNIIGTLLAIALVYMNFDFNGLYLGVLFGTVIVIMVSLLFSYRILNYFPFRFSYINHTLAMDIMRKSVIIFSANILNLLFQPAGKILISRYIGSIEVICYDLAFKLSFAIRNLFVIGLKALISEISGIQNEYYKLVDLLKKIYKYLLVSSVFVYGIFYIFSEQILRIWLADAYMPLMNFSFRVIHITYFLNLLAVPVYYCLFGQGHFKKILGVHSIQSILALALSLFYLVLLHGKSFEIFLFITFISTFTADLYLVFQFRKNILSLREAKEF